MGAERAVAERSRPFVRNYFATTAIAWWSDPPMMPLNYPTRWLWNYAFNEYSRRWFASGVAIAWREHLSMVLRSWVLRHLREHMIVLNPSRVTQAVDAAEHTDAVGAIEQLHARIDTALT
ncbi:hypothetical protein C7K25_08825 [Gulosibacter molinativorax]|uniref:Uncharacterized protein n=2 Tax=Gulosibacter molinativorax TaxID=256821 RepID=A0ABT7C8D9_9MICO|nr:hypothetical protein [Gulosibacter molinativorax]QUY62408.1 Hypotetical protein [Gulosibacter molinativorax]